MEKDEVPETILYHLIIRNHTRSQLLTSIVAKSIFEDFSLRKQCSKFIIFTDDDIIFVIEIELILAIHKTKLDLDTKKSEQLFFIKMCRLPFTFAKCLDRSKYKMPNTEKSYIN